ncbi:hypothetical protein KR009_006776, partial [Drosophila setifemur]
PPHPRTALVFLLCPILLMGAPLDHPNPKSQVEYISNEKPSETANVNAFVPITRPPFVTQTAPPSPPDSENFAFNPATKTWNKIEPGDPLPRNGTLVWNQKNDKWL